METWKQKLPFFSSSKYREIEKFLENERRSGKKILPAPENIFNAFKFTPFDQVRVVILGQDPYPNIEHAHGLAFSIPRTTTNLPPTLKNIFKELWADLGIKAQHGNLEHWAQEGVLLLNTALTVEQGKSNSHQRIGWKLLMQEVLQLLNKEKSHCVFILWGNNAQKYHKYISNPNHLRIETPHPSPLAAYRGFFGSKCFSRTNEYLVKNGLKAIDWRVI